MSASQSNIQRERSVAMRTSRPFRIGLGAVVGLTVVLRLLTACTAPGDDPSMSPSERSGSLSTASAQPTPSALPAAAQMLAQEVHGNEGIYPLFSLLDVEQIYKSGALVCQNFEDGASLWQVLNSMTTSMPGVDAGQAGAFVGTSVSILCPEYSGVAR